MTGYVVLKIWNECSDISKTSLKFRFRFEYYRNLKSFNDVIYRPLHENKQMLFNIW